MRATTQKYAALCIGIIERCDALIRTHIVPKKQKTTIRLNENGEVIGSSKALLSWLHDTFQLFVDGNAVISVERPKRSLAQNRKYWAMITEIAEGFRRAGIAELHMVGPDGEMVSIPVTKDLVHSWYKNKYLTPQEPGEEPSTTNLDTTAMSEYMEAVRHDEDVRKLDISFRDEDHLLHE